MPRGLTAQVFFLIALVAAIFAALTADAFYSRQSLSQELQKIERSILPALEETRRVEANLNALISTFERAAASEEPEGLARADQLEKKIEESLERLRGSSPAIAAGAQTLSEILPKYFDTARRVAESMAHGNRGPETVEQMKRMIEFHGAAVSAVRELRGRASSLSTQAFADANERHDRSLFLAIVLRVVGLSVLVVVSLWFVRGSLRSFREFRRGFRRLALGDFESRFTPRGRDEFGELCQEGNAVASSLQALYEEQQAAQAALRSKAHALEESNRRLDDFVRIASHDLKEPVRGVQAYASLLERKHGHELSAAAQNHLRTIVRLGGRISSQLVALREHARLGGLEITLCPVDLGGLVEDTRSSFVALLDDQRAELRVPLPLPKVMADPVLLAAVIGNLVLNGLTYSRGEPRWVQITAEPTSDEKCRITVRDNGIGLDPAHHDKIFVPFQRLHPRGEFGEGTGLGLTTVRDALRRMGADILISSEVNLGSAFSFELPFAEKAR